MAKFKIFSLAVAGFVAADFKECPTNMRPLLDTDRQKLIDAYNSIISTTSIDNPYSPSDITFQNLFIEKIETEDCINQKYYTDLMKIHAESNTITNKSLLRTTTQINTNCQDTECDVPITLKGIWGYGCWCNFGNNLLQGRGQPVNEHDAACKRMQHCLRCAEMDALADNYACDAKTNQYNSILGQSLPNINTNVYSLNSACGQVNEGNACGAHICTCEIQLINEILGLVWVSYTHDPAPRHPDNPFGGSFDYDSNCVVPPPSGPVGKDLACCGKYPFRYQYDVNEKDCCEKGEFFNAYNPLNQVCCTSGIEEVGNGGCNKKKK